MPDNTLSIKPCFTVKIVTRGDKYGLNNVHTHEHDDPLVEFFDNDYAGGRAFYPEGQFVARYYFSTIQEGNDGLCLDGGVPKWQVSSAEMAKVREWLRTLYPDFNVQREDLVLV